MNTSQESKAEELQRCNVAVKGEFMRRKCGGGMRRGLRQYRVGHVAAVCQRYFEATIC